MGNIIKFKDASDAQVFPVTVTTAIYDEENNTLDSIITGVKNMVGHPLTASTAASMTDTTAIYVYTGSESGYTGGNWYYYNGSAWVSGGVYNSTAFTTDTTLAVSGMAADAKVTGDEIGELKSDVDNITTWQNETSLVTNVSVGGAVVYNTGAYTDASSVVSAYKCSDYISVNKGDVINYSGVRAATSYAVIAYYNTSYTYDKSKSIAGTGVNGQLGRYTVPDFGYIRITCRNQELASSALFTITNVLGISLGNRPLFTNIKDFLDSGKIYAFLDRSIWQRGSLSATDGKTITASKYRLSTTEAITYSDATNLILETGWRIYTYYFDANDEKTSYQGWSNAVNIPAGSKCRFVFGRVTEDTSETISFDALDNVYVEYGISQRIDELNGSITSYWDTYLDSKYPTLWEKDALIGSGGDSFVFVTDPHYDYNVLKSPKIIKNVINNTAVNKVFCGGDIIDNQESVADAIKKMENWQRMLHGLKVFNIVGNHDNNNHDNTQPLIALTKGQYYGIMVKPAEQWVNTNGELYYCVDNESQKIRYICLAIECFDSIGTSGTQYTWLQSKLTEKDSTWTILVIQHRIWGTDHDSVSAKAQYVINAINAVWSSINAKFIGIISGHSHTDYDTTESTNGYLLIASNCDTNSGTYSGYTRTAGTTTEQSFDVFYIDKNNEKLYAVRIGAGDSVVGNGTGIREWEY